MVLANTTFVVDSFIDPTFRRWVTDVYLPAVRDAGFDSIVFSRILTEIDPATHNFSVQFVAPSSKEAMEWIDGTGHNLFSRLTAEHGTERILRFTTVMGILQRD